LKSERLQAPDPPGATGKIGGVARWPGYASY